MKRIRNIMVMICCMPFLVQCVATEQDVVSMDLKVRTMNNRMVEIENELGELKNEVVTNNSIDFIRQQQADLNELTERLKAELLQVKARLDEGSHLYRQTQKDARQSRNDIQMRIDNLTEQLNSLTQAVNETRQQLDMAVANIEDIKQARVREAAERATAAAQAAAQAAAAAKARELAAAAEKDNNGKRIIAPDQMKTKKSDLEAEYSPAQETAPEKTPTVSSDPAQALYDKGLNLFRQKKYKESYNVFAEYLEKYPNTKTAANAGFWMGDSLYNQKEFELAILEYQKVIADHPTHPKAAAAMLKQALAFQQLNDNDTAKIVFNKLIKDYPKSEQANAAREKLKTIK